ncbi:hypothetical protein G9U51_12265 [Calidifontibacter sp. DB0510]|uniref:Uncharacterized protein n=1 Tax=Metallococcus carri TaxID=1656884 RepID=A0A967EB38_9MICO|nr:hypothetical protein [Metallococcus carri]NHN56554.1 hypothetical protein [Metallococcus carri]NOP38853.1 hypothetical protein [Calidifontibacter sp. DB2511S]
MTTTDRPRAPRLAPDRPRAPRLATGALFGVTFVYLTLRAFVGNDLRDGTYVIALSRRMAAGDLPFRDELSFHTLGSAFAVPFTWVWLRLFDTTGLILAERLFTVAWICPLLYAAYRALSFTLPKVPCAAAICAAGMAIPYALIVTSYNTVSMFGLLLAFCAGFRTITSYHRGWAVTTAIAATLATIGFPAVGLGTAALLCLVGYVAHHRGTPWRTVLRDIGAPWLTLVVLFTLALALLGFESLRSALELQSAMRPESKSTLAIARLLRHELGFVFTTWRPALALVLSVIAALSRRRLVTSAAAIVAGLLMLDPAIEPPSANTLHLNTNTYPATMGLHLTVVLAPIAVRVARDHRDYRRLLRLSLVGLLAAAGVQQSTASGWDFGAAMTGATPLFTAVVLGYALHLRDACLPRPLRAAMVLPAAAVLACLTAVVFYDGPVLQHRAPATSGPAAGLWLSDYSSRANARVTRMTGLCPANARALIIDVPGAYLWLPARSASVSTWISRRDLHAVPMDRQLQLKPDCVIAASLAGVEKVVPADNVAQKRLLTGMRPAGPPMTVNQSPARGEDSFQVWVRADNRPR